MEFDGLVVEGASGVRIIAIPLGVWPALNDATVIQFQTGGRCYRMRVDDWSDGDSREHGTPVDDVVHHSPTPPPVLSLAGPALLTLVPGQEDQGWYCTNITCGTKCEPGLTVCPWCETARRSPR